MAVTITNLDPPLAPAGFPRTSPISFDLASDGGAIDFAVLFVRFMSDVRQHVIYESDGFTVPYASASSVTGDGTETVSFSIFEFGGWRDRIYELRAVAFADGELFRINFADL